MDSYTLYPVPVVRLIIPDAEGKILILKRANSEYSQGSWCLPGGKIDYGDTIDNTIKKELQEETSLVCISSRFLFYQDSLPQTKGKMHCINLYFECMVEGRIVLNEESGEYAWIDREDMKTYDIAFRNDEALMKYFKDMSS